MSFLNKLIPAMRSSAGWQGFTNALDKLNEQAFEPVITRFKALSDLSQMSSEDIDIRLSELGLNFSIGDNERQNGALAYQQRFDELKYKGHAYQITQTLAREFNNMFVRFPKVYAPRPELFGTDHNHNYGEHFLMETELVGSGFSRDQLFLTSRALIEVSTGDVFKQYGMDTAAQDAFEADLNRLVVPIIPAHIVYDGVRYVVRVPLTLESKWSHTIKQTLDIDVKVNFPQVRITPKVSSTLDDGFSISMKADASYDTSRPVTTRMDVMPMDAWGFDAPFPHR